jgi:PAS domain S-box-containing protein
MTIHVLLIDDSDDDALLIQRHFRRAGIDITAERVETAGQLADALRRPPDVVICDYNMPAFSAHGALEQIHEAGLDVPFVLVSGQVGEETAAALMKAGAHDFMLKDRLARLVPAVQRELRDAADRRQRRAAQAALRVSEERFRLLAEHAQDIIFRYRRTPTEVLFPAPGNSDGTENPGPGGAVEYLSPAVQDIIGYTPDELYADPALIFALVEPEDRAVFEGSWRFGEPAALTVRWRRRDGGVVYLEQRAAAVRDDAGSIVAVEGILRDTTERMLADEERQRLEHQLRQNERLDSLGQLAGGVAHDFNNLLAVIVGYCDMVAESLADDDPGQADVEGIRKAADRGAALIRQLLIFSRLEPSRLERVDLNAIVEDTREILSRTLGEHITVVTRLDEGLKAVQADRSKMEQVLFNLILNARAAMPNGGLLTIETANADDSVLLSVADNGHGMDPEVAGRAFEPFFTTRPKGEGTGLGLATAYGAVINAGGSIDLSSEPGAGTTVTIRLPALLEPAGGHGEAAPEAGDAEPAPGDTGSAVLLVEDEDAVREVTLRQLARVGYRVRDIASPLEAVRVFSDDPQAVDLLLTDIVMPGMSGTQLASRLRAIRPDLPVLFMSGYTSGPAPGGHELPSDGSLLHKPFDRSALLAAVRQALRNAQ